MIEDSVSRELFVDHSEEIERLTADNARLRKLIAKAERTRSNVDMGGSAEDTCPWCGRDALTPREPVNHRVDCEAFSAPGVPR